MAHGEAKVYFDGSHYIAIPKAERPTAKKGGGFYEKESEEKKKAFEKAYKGTKAKRKKEKLTEIVAEIAPHFKNEAEATAFVIANMERKTRNITVRRVRLARKINLGNWNYFCTFTYDDKKHTEETFKKGLSNCFKKLCYRKGWIYLGVWERAPNTNRLHFHGLFHIPENAMVGELEEHNDFSFATHSRQITLQNTYFNKRFGRSDFSLIDNRDMLGNATAYLMKYIEKSGERIVYSKGTHAYFISDILDEDVVCTIGQEDRKLLLFDDFSCFDEGCYIGKVSPEVIEKLRKTN